MERHTEKSKGTVTPESEGRVIDGHQSNFNLNIVIATGSGAYFKIGLTAHHVRSDLLSIWWSPGSGMDSLHRQFAECIFYDVTEADHIDVNVLKKHAASGANRTRAAANRGGKAGEGHAVASLPF